MMLNPMIYFAKWSNRLPSNFKWVIAVHAFCVCIYGTQITPREYQENTNFIQILTTV
jgi:hypothetical protein